MGVVKVEFIEVPEGGGPVGTVLYEREFRLTVDAAAILPAIGDTVVLPHPHRKQRSVVRRVYKYGKANLTIQVHLRSRFPSSSGRSRRAAAVPRRRGPSVGRVREAAKKL